MSFYYSLLPDYTMPAPALSAEAEETGMWDGGNTRLGESETVRSDCRGLSSCLSLHAS